VNVQPFPRREVLTILAMYGIADARRAKPQEDEAEEVILVSPEAFQRIDEKEISLALRRVIPHTKVWVVADVPPWVGDPI
jgi:hypothetical protein